MKERKVVKKVGPSKVKRVEKPIGPPRVEPTDNDPVFNPIMALNQKMEKIMEENNALKNQFNGLIQQLDKKFTQMDEIAQEELAQKRSNEAQPVQQETGSEGVLNKTLGSSTLGEVLGSIRDIANAWMTQNRIEQEAQGMKNVNNVFQQVGQSVFEKFIQQKGLNVENEEAVESTTHSTTYQ